MADAADAAAAAITAWFAAQPQLPVERSGSKTWSTVLAGERKRAIPVHLQLGAHQLAVESLFMRAPDERHAEVYAYLLRRNLRSYTLRFALGDAGDVLLVGLLPRSAVTVDELDRMLGQLLAVADECYWPAVRLGFTSYIAREQAWREQLGMARNPIT